MSDEKSEKKGGLRGFMKNAGLWEDKEEAPVKVVLPTPSPVSKTPNSPTLTVSATIHPNESNGFVNPEIEANAIKYFNNLMESANLPGPDFWEFFNALKTNMASFGSSITDERVLYNMVFNTMASVGLKFDVLISSHKQYDNLLLQKYNAFLEENKKLMQSAVGDNNKIIESIKVANVNRKKQIEQLQKDIEQDELKMTQIQEEIHSETQNIEDSKVAFSSAFNKVKTDFDQTIEKVKINLAPKQ